MKLTTNNLAKLINAYNKAVKNNQQVFTFEKEEISTAYIAYYLDYFSGIIEYYYNQQNKRKK